MNHSDLSHKWAHNEDPEAHRRCGNMSYEGMRLFSWSTCIMEKAVIRGQKVVFCDPQTHSSYTSRMRSHGCSALPPEWRMLDVPTVYGRNHQSLIDRYRCRKKWAREQVAELIKMADAHIAKSKRCRKEWSISGEIDAAERCLEDARSYAELFDRRISVPDGRDLIPEEVAKHREQAAKRAREKQKKRATDQAERLELWFKGEVSYGQFYDCPCKLRVKQGHIRNEETGDLPKDIQTSHGAAVPYDEGERCFRFAIARRKKGWKRNGEQFKVGVYALDAVNEHGVVAGCHRIGWDEIVRFAKQEGWMI